MKVIVKIPTGERVQGAHVRVKIPSISIAGNLITYNKYDRTITTNDRGEATFPNPGLTAIGGIAEIHIEVEINGRNYEYYGSEPVTGLGTIANEHVAVMSAESYKEDPNPLLALSENAVYIVGGVVLLATLGLVSEMLKPRRYVM